MSILSQLDQNTTYREAFIALRTWLGLYSSKQTASALESCLQILKTHFDSKIFMFDSGRTALYEGLLALEQIQPNKNEVMVSAYTCSVVVNAILKAGLKPVFIDINMENFTLNKTLLQKYCSQNTLAIMIQNTFGFIDDYQYISTFAKDNNIYFIEDLAQSLTSLLPDNKIGQLSDFAFLSFGSGKIVSCSRGGALIANNSKLKKILFDHYAKLDALPLVQVRKHLFKIFTFYFFTKFYFFSGKYFLAILAKLDFFPKIILQSEKNFEHNCLKSYQFSEKLSLVLLPQLKNLRYNLLHRNTISRVYSEILPPEISYQFTPDLALIGYPLNIKNPEKLYKMLLKRRIQLCIEWTTTNIVPKDINHKRSQYIPGSCKNAEQVAKNMIYLPTHNHISIRKAKLICKKIIKYSNYGKLHN